MRCPKDKRTLGLDTIFSVFTMNYANGDRSDHGDTGYDCCVENQGLMSYSVQDLSLRVQGR
ncbi:MAG: hypothetical protein KME50_30595 [Nostoc desertorum CM1-VF14]|nr:hypothetical protein [Nostoc desertorum CM1-VF14]